MKGLELQDNRAGCKCNDMVQKSMKFIRTEYGLIHFICFLSASMNPLSAPNDLFITFAFYCFSAVMA